jgi:hypothetical protein
LGPWIIFSPAAYQTADVFIFIFRTYAFAWLEPQIPASKLAVEQNQSIITEVKLSY